MQEEPQGLPRNDAEPGGNMLYVVTLGLNAAWSDAIPSEEGHAAT